MALDLRVFCHPRLVPDTRAELVMWLSTEPFKAAREVCFSLVMDRKRTDDNGKFGSVKESSMGFERRAIWTWEV
jgi:hypothetical protein